MPVGKSDSSASSCFLRALSLGNSFLIIHDTHCFRGDETAGKISFFPRKKSDFKSSSTVSILIERER